MSVVRRSRSAVTTGGSLPGWLWLLLAAAVLGWLLLGRGPGAVERAPGMLAPNVPAQGPVRDAPPERIGRFRIAPLHAFELEARVLGREDYRFDAGSEISPTDLAVGWGRMSDSAVLERLEIDQAARFYSYRWGRDGPPIPPAEIVRSSANMHMIPVDESAAVALRRVAPGQVVRIEGWLVRVDRDDGWNWTSSTRRDDSGAGACELVLVNRLWTDG